MAAKKTTTTKKQTKKPQPRKKTQSKKPQVRRELWGIVYFILTFLTIFAIVGFDGFLLGAYFKMVTFFIGFGIYILPVCLIMMAILCFVNFKGNTSLRSIVILITPILASCFIQVLLYGDTYRMNFDDLSLIISKGMEGQSAGIIGGFICIILEASLSSIGALVLLGILNITGIFIAFNLTPVSVYQNIKKYFDGLAYEEDEDETEYRLSQREMKKVQKEKQKEHNDRLKQAKLQAMEEYKEQAPVKTPKKYKAFDIDIALDNEPIQQPENSDNPEKPKADAWIVDAYEKIKDKNDLEKKERIEFLKNQNEHQQHNEEDKIDYVMEDLSEIKLVYDEEIVNDISNNIDDILKNYEPKEIIEPINDVKDENDFKHEEVNIEEIKEAILETLDDSTMRYTAIKEEIIPDLLKSTMKYETVSDFDPNNLTYKYVYPQINLLTPKLRGSEVDPTIELRESSDRLIDTLDSFGIAAKIIHIVRGPSITRFEITISKGVKFSKITALSDDIALSLGAVNVRIAPIPDKVAIGIEVPNKTTEMVLIREVLDSNEFRNTTSKLSYALGKDITGKPAIGDIAKMPHMLIAGTTGSGKSVCVNAMLVSLLYKADPTEVKFIMIDPKMVELGGYNGIPHLLIPVVTDPKKAAGALNWAVSEMMKRYKLLAECNVKDLASYNMVMAKRQEEGDLEAKKLPQIVIVIDELADLMMIAAKEVEESICRIAQMARAAGMHLVIATQRPSSDVITGIMKANIPSRISFAVSSQIESRIILDTTGAEKLIGKGDMLYNPLGASKPQRLQGCFITSTEVEVVVEHVKTIAKPDYSEEVMNHIENHATSDSGGSSHDSSDGDEDPIIDDAIDIIVSTGQASTSFLQRKLKLGYARASRVIDQIEDRGIIGQPDGSKPRQILITKQQWQEMKVRKMD